MNGGAKEVKAGRKKLLGLTFILMNAIHVQKINASAFSYQ